jgi:hypothetical protein
MSIYGSLFEAYDSPSPYARTSGPDDEEENDRLAEEISEEISDQALTAGYDSGATMALNPMSLLATVTDNLTNALGFKPPATKIQKVVEKVKVKVPAKVQAKARAPQRAAPARIGFRMPARQQGRNPIRDIKDLMQRVEWCQLASLTGAPVTLGPGATLVTTLTTTRTGLVLDWSTNDTTNEVLASNLTYGQMPNTLFSPTPISLWSPLAANPSPIQPLYITMPATANVTLTNTNTGTARVVTWQWSGIPDQHMHLAAQDPDVVEFLRGRGFEIARGFQAY